MKYLILSTVTLLIIGQSWASPENVSSEHYFDVLIFTQHWPNTVCIQWKEKEENHTCLLSQQWGVHGVWPTKFGTIGPGFCNNSWHFHPEELQPIQKQLDQHWPNILNGTEEDSLWKHEWQKHGTCAAQLRPLNTEIKYFSQGLAWLAQYDMTNLLNKAGIYPSETNTYSVDNIWQAIKRAVHTNAAVECHHDHETGETYLFEIRICFNKELELVDCDGIISSPQGKSGIITNCPAGSTIKYPIKVPGGVDPRKLKTGWTWMDFAEFLLFLQWLTF